MSMSQSARSLLFWRWLLRALTAGWLLGGVVAGARAQEPPPMVVQQVSEGCYFVEGLSALGSPANQNFISNAGFVVTRDSVVVIDALGSEELARRLMAEIRRITPLPVSHVMVTHYHADHIYGLQAFKAAGAKILAQEEARIYLNSDTARLRLEASREELAPWVNAETHLVPADEWVKDRREMTLGGVKFVLQHVGPAHTPEDMAVFLPEKGVLYAGDLVFRSRIPFVGQADSRQWIASLETLLGLNAGVMVPGHGGLSTDARRDMTMTHDYLVYLRQSMARAVKDLEPFDEAYQNTDWTAWQSFPLFRVANRMNAYNTYLQLEKEGL
jgi:glyoxylase-like metal-dependent hydrolase (beta-lactamase superfamily II)